MKICYKSWCTFTRIKCCILANNLWLVIATSMVFLTNAGLAFFKIASGICVSQSIATLIIPTLAYWFMGYSLMYGFSAAVDEWLYYNKLFLTLQSLKQLQRPV